MVKNVIAASQREKIVHDFHSMSFIPCRLSEGNSLAEQTDAGSMGWPLRVPLLLICPSQRRSNEYRCNGMVLIA